MYTKGEWKASHQFPYNVYPVDGNRPPTTTPIATMTAPDQIEKEANAHIGQSSWTHREENRECQGKPDRMEDAEKTFQGGGGMCRMGEGKW